MTSDAASPFHAHLSPDRSVQFQLTESNNRAKQSIKVKSELDANKLFLKVLCHL